MILLLIGIFIQDYDNFLFSVRPLTPIIRLLTIQLGSWCFFQDPERAPVFGNAGLSS